VCACAGVCGRVRARVGGCGRVWRLARGRRGALAAGPDRGAPRHRPRGAGSLGTCARAPSLAAASWPCGWPASSGSARPERARPVCARVRARAGLCGRVRAAVGDWPAWSPEAKAQRPHIAHRSSFRLPPSGRQAPHSAAFGTARGGRVGSGGVAWRRRLGGALGRGGIVQRDQACPFGVPAWLATASFGLGTGERGGGRGAGGTRGGRPRTVGRARARIGARVPRARMCMRSGGPHIPPRLPRGCSYRRASSRSRLVEVAPRHRRYFTSGQNFSGQTELKLCPTQTEAPSAPASYAPRVKRRAACAPPRRGGRPWPPQGPAPKRSEARPLVRTNRIE
jgi:hypothetical protein